MSLSMLTPNLGEPKNKKLTVLVGATDLAMLKEIARTGDVSTAFIVRKLVRAEYARRFGGKKHT